METSCAYNENIFIKEEWLEDVVYKKTDKVGGYQHVHVNQSLIRVAADLDHDYCMRNVKIKSEPQDHQNKDDDTFIEELYVEKRICEAKYERSQLSEDHSSEDTLTAEEDTYEMEGMCKGVVHASESSSNGRSHWQGQIIKNERYGFSTNKGIDQIDDCRSNFACDTGEKCRVREPTIKQECVELMNDDTTAVIDREIGGGENNFHSMLAEDQWREDTLTASEDVEEIDDGWNPEDHYGEIALSPGEFIEEMDDGRSIVAHDLRGSAHDNVIEEEQRDDDKVIKEGEAENDDPYPVVAEESQSEMCLSPGEFIEEVYDGWDTVGHDSYGKPSLYSTALDKDEQRDIENGNDSLILDGFCTLETKKDNASSVVAKDGYRDRALSAEGHTVKKDCVIGREAKDCSCSFPGEFVDCEKYDFSLDEALGEDTDAADSDESWKPPKKLERKYKKKTLYACSSCGYECDKQILLERHMKLSKTCENPYACDLCDKRHSKSSAPNEHKIKHSGKVPDREKHSCYIRRNRATSNSSLKRRKLVHTAEKAYACSVCNVAFRQVGTWKTHMKNHRDFRAQCF